MQTASTLPDHWTVNDWSLHRKIPVERISAALGVSPHAKIHSLPSDALERLAENISEPETDTSITSESVEDLAANSTSDIHSWFPFFTADAEKHPPLYGSEQGPSIADREYRRE